MANKERFNLRKFSYGVLVAVIAGIIVAAVTRQGCFSPRANQIDNTTTLTQQPNPPATVTSTTIQSQHKYTLTLNQLSAGDYGEDNYTVCAVIPFDDPNKDHVLRVNSHGHKMGLEIWEGRIAPGTEDWWVKYIMVKGNNGRQSQENNPVLVSDPTINWTARSGEYTIMVVHSPHWCRKDFESPTVDLIIQ